MPTPTLVVDRLSLSPLGAGDLIDRTVRLYRQHFSTLIRAAAPPVVVSAVGSVLWTVGWRGIPLTESGERLAFYIVCVVAGWVLMAGGSFFFLLVMGGASRNLVMHLLSGDPVSARTIYQSVRSRFWALNGALVLIVLFGSMIGFIIFFVWLIAVSFTVAGTISIIGDNWFAALIVVAIVLALSMVALLCYFWIIGRLAYVPQVMLVEGRGVFDSFSRSASLARGNVRRLTAMFLFTTFATYSALMLLLIPLGWYGYLQGIDPFTLQATNWPLWYAIGRQVLVQVSSILLAPVWMLGLSLLYVDERVRHEGYDIELVVAQRLGEMPLLPDGRLAPLVPALAATTTAVLDHQAARQAAQQAARKTAQQAALETSGTPERRSSTSVLGLMD